MSRPLLTDQDWDYMVNRVAERSANYDESVTLIYQWVKIDRISPRQMGDLIEKARAYWGLDK